MRKNIASRLGGAIAICAAFAAVTSCSAPKNITYFQDTAPEAVITMAAEQPITAQPGDKLSIIVHTKDPAVSSMFNLPTYSQSIEEPSVVNGTINSSSRTNGTTSDGVARYTVSPDGYIDFPILGRLHIGGMTRNEIAGFVKGELMGRDLVKDPTVTVEFVNAAVNVMGSVARPGRYAISSDRFSVSDALAMAGDIALTGMRQNVKVIRRENGKAKTYVIDMTNAQKTLGSPAYYLQQDDIIYVEPNELVKRTTVANGNQATNVGFWISLASLLTTVATTIGVFINK